MPSDREQLLGELYRLGDAGDFDAYVEALDPAFEWRTAVEAPDPGVYHGREGARQVLENFHSLMSDVRHHIEAVVESPPEVVVLVKVTCRGRYSGVPVEESRAHVWTFDGNRPVRVRAYLDRERARADTGIEAP